MTVGQAAHFEHSAPFQTANALTITAPSPAGTSPLPAWKSLLQRPGASVFCPMSLEAIQNEVAAWPEEMVRRLQGYLVALNHQRTGTLQRLSAKIDDHDPAHWFTLDQTEAILGLADKSDDEA